MSAVGTALRFQRGVRSLVAGPRPSLAGARRRLGEAAGSQEERFLWTLEQLVLGRPESPFTWLLACAGAEPGDVRRLVRGDGLGPALASLRDAGVYVAYEEWLGEVPTVRGSATRRFEPRDFTNPVARPDFLAGTGGTRSGGIPVAWSFDALRRGVDPYLLRAETWRVRGTPAAIWLPPQPSAAGLATALLLAAAERPPERWFSPLPAASATPRDRVVDYALRALARSAAVELPRPEPVVTTRPDAVLDWCASALRRSDQARLGAYASAAVRLADAAVERGVSLAGLVIATLGEPLGGERAAAIRASGAEPAAGYGFMQKGTVGHACPECEPEELHLLESEAAVITRDRPAPDGGRVSAFLWSALDPDAPTVMLNTENDDYGELVTDASPCGCELGRIGFRRRLRGVRGLSKVSVEGMSVASQVLAELALSLLPAQVGGGPGDFQFVQLRGHGPARLTLRISPRVAGVDAEEALGVVRARLRETAPGALAAGVWDGSRSLGVERCDPRPAPSGKVLPVELT